MFFGIVFLSKVAIGQQNNVYNSFGIDYNYGGILKHSSELPSIGSNRINGFTINYSRIPTAKSKWDQCFCFPEISYGLAYYNFGDPEMLGYSLNPFMSVAPYLNPHGRLHFLPRFAAGLSYVSEVYDVAKNPENNFFSSHISGFLQASFSLKYGISDHFQLSSSFSYNHISNGGLKQPNKGMNFLTADVGLKYSISKMAFPSYTSADKRVEDKKRWRYRINTSYTLKVAQKQDLFDRKNTSVIGFMTTAGYFIPRFSIVEAGFEFIADGYLKEQLYRMGTSKDYKRFSLIAGHTAKFGRLGFSTLLGVYLYSPYKAVDPVYQRYQLTYDISSKLYFGVGLKAHRHVAELMLVSLGVRL